MRDSFLRVAAATPKVKVADPSFNKEQMIELIDSAREEGVKILVFPELCITGYTCGDLFWQQALLLEAKEALRDVIAFTEGSDMIVAVGIPYERKGKLYNVQAVIQNGTLIGLIPKIYIPNHGEFGEGRYFASGNSRCEQEWFTDKEGISYNVPFGADLLFACENHKEIVIAGELCEDLWVPCPPSIGHALAGATIMMNSSASDELTGKDEYRRKLVAGQSARLICGYIYSSAGEGESTQDLVFSGHNLIYEKGTLLGESRLLSQTMTIADLDMERIQSERRRMNTFFQKEAEAHTVVPFFFEDRDYDLMRYVNDAPFVPSEGEKRMKRCDEILNIQALGLKKRLEHTGCETAVIGISGGLDSTLALLVIGRAFDMLGLDHKGIVAVTMPCFGTTDRTYQNACKLTLSLGATLREVDIKAAVLQHFADIGHDPGVKNVTYENGQARERTQVIMDIANDCNGMVIGTGDMSELALGWATYNGDHMSMYGVNASVPKTLVRHLVRYYADTCEDQELAAILYDVLDTPVSPELLPPEDGEIAQKTEDIVGPYELHDFFIYYTIRYGYRPKKIFRLAQHAFEGVYDDETIKKWLRTFFWRYFSQQFKRSCLPDGPKVGSVGVSPRGDLKMPSDASFALWRKELDEI